MHEIVTRKLSLASEPIRLGKAIYFPNPYLNNKASYRFPDYLTV